MKKIKQILPYFLWTISIVLIGIILSFSVKNQKKINCEAIEVTITDKNEQQFLEEKNILDLIDNNNENIKNKNISNIDIYKLEEIVNSHPSVEKANVAIEINGKLKIELTQRVPIARIFNANNESYYIDNKGKAMPLSEQFTADVLPFNGFINEPFTARMNYNVDFLESNTRLKNLVLFDDIYNIANCIKSDSILSALIQQVYVNEKKEFEIITSLTNARIILGNCEDLSSKLNKLKIFFREGLSKNNWWEKYQSIDIRFKNQIICKK